MSDLTVRIEGRAGRITLNRPQALNALTWDMVLGIEAALDGWLEDPDVALIVLDGAGDKAFCAGGDIADMYAAGLRGDHAYAERFWRDEYRLNAKLYAASKPVISFLHGVTMGGGVGVGCHAALRVVCDNSIIALPECSIGLVPDVGGSLLLAQAPGRIGEYLGVTGDRMDAGDAIFAGFADIYLPQDAWPEVIAQLCETGDVSVLEARAAPAPESRLAGWQTEIDAVFGGERLGDIWRAMPDPLPEPLAHATRLMARNAPLAQAVTVQMIHRVRAHCEIRFALDQESRYTFRAFAQGDFIEGIRAAIIDRDRNPRWQHASWQDVKGGEVLRMTLPLGKAALKWEETP